MVSTKFFPQAGVEPTASNQQVLDARPLERLLTQSLAPAIGVDRCPLVVN